MNHPNLPRNKVQVILQGLPELNAKETETEKCRGDFRVQRLSCHWCFLGVCGFKETRFFLMFHAQKVFQIGSELRYLHYVARLFQSRPAPTAQETFEQPPLGVQRWRCCWEPDHPAKVSRLPPGAPATFAG